MKILFLCSSLELGRDGVGDYTRRLSGELVRQGHHILIFALNDSYINKVLEEKQVVEDTIIQVLRVPPNLFKNEDFLCTLSAKIDEFNPDWISFQFVPFGFDNKGLPFGLRKLFKLLGQDRKWHVMFHELWVGMDENASMKHIGWGWLQRRLIKSLLATLHPKAVTTQTQLYKEQLSKIGVAAEYLPLFGNIPLLQKANKCPVCITNLGEVKTCLTFILFGGIHSGVPIKQFATEVAEYGLENKIDVKLVLIGRCGAEQTHWVSVWQSLGLLVEVLGEQSAECVSAVLNTASIGIATTPLFLIEKSGSVAAMREHSLPVLCVSRVWYPRGLSKMIIPNGFFEYQLGNLHSLIRHKFPSSKGHSVSEVARQFVNILSPNLY